MTQRYEYAAECFDSASFSERERTITRRAAAGWRLVTMLLLRDVDNSSLIELWFERPWLSPYAQVLVERGALPGRAGD